MYDFRLREYVVLSFICVNFTIEMKAEKILSFLRFMKFSSGLGTKLLTFVECHLCRDSDSPVRLTSVVFPKQDWTQSCYHICSVTVELKLSFSYFVYLWFMEEE